MNTQVYGTGKYRFNQYGSDGVPYWQYRFKTKDAAITFLCGQMNRLYQVKPGMPHYEVNLPQIDNDGLIDDDERAWH